MADRGCAVYSDLCGARFVETLKCARFPITNYAAVQGTNYTGLAAGVTSFTPPPATPKTGFAIEGLMEVEITTKYEETAEVIKKDGCGKVCYRRAPKKCPSSADIKIKFCRQNIEAFAAIGGNRLYTAAGITTGFEVLQNCEYPHWWGEFYRHVDYGDNCDALTPTLNRVFMPSFQLYPPESLMMNSEVQDIEMTGTAAFVKSSVTGYTGPWQDIDPTYDVFASGVAGLYGSDDLTPGATPPPGNCTGLIDVA